MQNHDCLCRHSRVGRHRVLVGALAVLLLGGAGFAAAGGVEAVRGWFTATVTAEVNGEVTDVREVVFDEQGRASMPLTLPDPGDEDGVTIGFTFEGGPAPGGAEGGEVIRIDADLTGETVRFEVTPEGARSDTPAE